MEGRALKNCLTDNFSDGAGMQRRDVTRRNSVRPPVPVLWQKISFCRKRRVCSVPTKQSEDGSAPSRFTG